MFTHRRRESPAQRLSGHPIRRDVLDFAHPPVKGFGVTLTAIPVSLGRSIKPCGEPCSILPSVRGRLFDRYRPNISVLRVQ